MGRWAALVGVMMCCSPALASAQLRPTSDAASVHGGRTMGNGEVLISGGIGWPGIWVGVLLSPNSRFDLSIRAHVDYGALLGTDTGFGGSISVPMRRLLFASGRTDLSLSVRPFFALGEGAHVGQTGVFNDNFGFGAGLDAGIRVGFSVSDMTTLCTGAHLTFGYLDTSAADSHEVYGAASALFAVELVMSRSTMLFAAVEVGYGLLPDGLFSSPLLLRGSLGLSYRL